MYVTNRNISEGFQFVFFKNLLSPLSQLQVMLKCDNHSEYIYQSVGSHLCQRSYLKYRVSTGNLTICSLVRDRRNKESR